jgi:hypothetical protein
MSSQVEGPLQSMCPCHLHYTPADRDSVTYLHFPTGTEGSEIDMSKFLKGSTEVNNLAPFRIVHLKDFPYFQYGGPRVVDWAQENPGEKLKPQE